MDSIGDGVVGSDGEARFLTLVKLMVPFLAPANARVERRQDLASMVKNLAGP